MKTYLLKIRQYDITVKDFKLKIYKVTTDNIYRIIGKIYCTALEEIKRIDYSEWMQEREDYWIENGYDIIDYKEPRLSEDGYGIRLLELIDLINLYKREIARDKEIMQRTNVKDTDFIDALQEDIRRKERQIKKLEYLKQTAT